MSDVERMINSKLLTKVGLLMRVAWRVVGDPEELGVANGTCPVAAHELLATHSVIPPEHRAVTWVESFKRTKLGKVCVRVADRSMMKRTPPLANTGERVPEHWAAHTPCSRVRDVEHRTLTRTGCTYVDVGHHSFS